MYNELKRMLLVCAIAAISFSAQAAVIGFDDIGENGTPFTLYTEDGFMVFPAGGADWVNNTVYGAPAPSVIFNRKRGEPEIWAGIFVRAEETLPFTFSAVDLYSSLTPIPYRFIGYKDGMPVFDVSNTMPNTFGSFKTAFNPDFASSLIDLLYIELVNPFVACCSNPVGLDNIVVTRAIEVPEPGSLPLALIAASLLLTVGSRNNRRGAPQ